MICQPGNGIIVGIPEEIAFLYLTKSLKTAQAHGKKTKRSFFFMLGEFPEKNPMMVGRHTKNKTTTKKEKTQKTYRKHDPIDNRINDPPKETKPSELVTGTCFVVIVITTIVRT